MNGCRGTATAAAAVGTALHCIAIMTSLTLLLSRIVLSLYAPFFVDSVGTVSFSYSLDRVCLIIELSIGKSTTITANTNTSLRRLLLLGRLASVPSWSDRLLQPEWTAAVGQESEERKYLAFVSHFKLECQAETYLYSLLQFADLLYYAPIRRGQHCAALHSLVRR